MQIKSVPFVPIKEVDKSLPFKGAKVNYSVSCRDCRCSLPFFVNRAHCRLQM